MKIKEISEKLSEFARLETLKQLLVNEIATVEARIRSNTCDYEYTDSLYVALPITLTSSSTFIQYYGDSYLLFLRTTLDKVVQDMENLSV
jgi:hypothetical protein